MDKRTQVSEWAVLGRVNRVLARGYESLRKWRSSGIECGQSYAPGDYYRVDHDRNTIIDFCVDLEAFARDIHALQPGEAMAA